MSDFTGERANIDLGFGNSAQAAVTRRRTAQPDQIAPLQGLVVAVLLSSVLWIGIAAAIRAIV